MANIESLAAWSKTGNPRTATPGSAFWAAWRTEKEFIKRQGVRCYKTDAGDWVLEWTQFSQPAQTSNKFQTPHEAKTCAKKEIVWSDEQKAIHDWFANGTNNLVIRARAGTGKTATSKAGFELAPEERMLYAVFNKKNQIEAQAKITDPRVEVKTLHSVGYACIVRVWSGSKPDANLEHDRVVTLIGEDAPFEVFGAIEKLVGWLKNNFLNPSLDEAVATAESLGIEAEGFESEEKGGWNVTKLAECALAVLELSKSQDPEKRISFDDMVWLPVVMNWVRPWYDLVLVDEAQDMNLPQLLMAQRCARGRICVVGDDRQCIYGFRGAVHDGLSMMKRELNAGELGLTTTYRCAKSIVGVAKQFVPDYNHHESNGEGMVDSIGEQELYNQVQTTHAILSRTNAQLMPICLRLLRRNIPARIEGKDIGKALVALVRKMKAKSVPDFIERITKWGNKIRVRILKKKNGAEQIAQIQDQVETLIAVAEDMKSVTEIETRISSLFQDSGEATRAGVVLSTVHKAKGLEWDRVFILRQTFLRNQSREEENIYYVAVTRARKHLTFIGGAAPEKKLSGETLNSALRCQDFQRRSFDE